MQLKKRVYNLFDLLRIPFAVATLPMSFLAASSLARSAVPTLQVLAVAAFIDTSLGVLGGTIELSAVYPRATAVAALVGFAWISDQLNRFAITRVGLRLYAGLRTAFIDKRARLLYRHIENPETWDLVSRVSDKPEEKIGEGATEWFGLVSTLLTVSGLLAILFTRIWWAAIAIVGVSVPLLSLSGTAGVLLLLDGAKPFTERQASLVKAMAAHAAEIIPAVSAPPPPPEAPDDFVDLHDLLGRES